MMMESVKMHIMIGILKTFHNLSRDSFWKNNKKEPQIIIIGVSIKLIK